LPTFSVIAIEQYDNLTLLTSKQKRLIWPSNSNELIVMLVRLLIKTDDRKQTVVGVLNLLNLNFRITFVTSKKILLIAQFH